MQKLSERITANYKRNENRNGQQIHRATFLCHKEEIMEAAKEGWGVKAIWRTLKDEGKFYGTYECFLGYFNEYRKNTGKYGFCQDCPYYKMAGVLHHEGKTKTYRRLVRAGWWRATKNIQKP